MRIVHLFRVFIAVLSLAAVFNPVKSNEHSESIYSENNSKHTRKHQSEMHEWYDSQETIRAAGKMLTPRENQMVLKQESKNRNSSDCCPSVLEMVEPEGGKNQDDQYVELYRDGNNRQRFYELSCHQDVLEQPCRFIDKKLHSQSKCVQKYSYTYALVKDPGRHHTHHHRPNYFPSISSGPNETRWTLDYIRVRSGCSCMVKPNDKKKRINLNKNKRRHDED